MKLKMFVYAFLILYFACGSFLHALRTPEDTVILRTTFGVMANMSDVIGLGVVTNSTTTNYCIRIEQALYGCTNGQTITVLQESLGPLSNATRIAFAVVSNIYSAAEVDMYKFDSGMSQTTPQYVLPEYVTLYHGRYWFYFDDSGGHTYTYFTNVVRTMKTQKNWTNYYEVCRSAATVPSVRVKEDGFYDLWRLIRYATNEQLDMMMADPLLTLNFKDYIPRYREYREALLHFHTYGGEHPDGPVPARFE